MQLCATSLIQTYQIIISILVRYIVLWSRASSAKHARTKNTDSPWFLHIISEKRYLSYPQYSRRLAPILQVIRCASDQIPKQPDDHPS